jgi:hypothetical protein
MVDVTMEVILKNMRSKADLVSEAESIVLCKSRFIWNYQGDFIIQYELVWDIKQFLRYSTAPKISIDTAHLNDAKPYIYT